MKAKAPLLTHEQEIELAKLAKYSKDKNVKRKAIDKLIVSNIRLVNSVAYKYSNNDPALFNDLFQEGCIGLYRAIKGYDEESGFRFSTYAVWWIRQVIRLYISNNGRNIRTPVYVIEKVSKINKMRKELAQKLGRAPTPFELAEAVELDPSKIHEFEMAVSGTSSLDFKIGDGENSTLGDVIEDAEAKTPDENLIEQDQNRVIGTVLARLTPREERVIRLRFGIGVNKEHTLDEVAVILGGLTKERIRQIEVQALGKLKKGVNIRKLKEVY